MSFGISALSLAQGSDSLPTLTASLETSVRESSGPVLFVTRNNIELGRQLKSIQESTRVYSKEDLSGWGPKEMVRLLRSEPWGCIMIEDTAVDMIRREELYTAFLILSRADQRWILTSDGDSVAAKPVHQFRSGFSMIPSMVAEGYKMGRGLYQALRLKKKLDNRAHQTITRASDNQRVAYLKTEFWFDVKAGGSISHARGVLGGMIENGWTPRIWSTTKVPGVDPKVPQTIVAPEKRPSLVEESALAAFNRHFLDTIRDEVRNFSPGVIYQRHGVFSLAGLALARELGVPLVLEVNASEVWAKEAWSRLYFASLAREMERVAFEQAERLVLISKPLIETIGSLGGDKERMVVNPNGVDVSRFNPLERGETLRAKFGFDENSVVCGFVGTFHKWHGVLFLADLIPKLLPEHPTLRFLFVGDGDHRPQAEAILQRAGASDCVHFTGLVAPNEISSLLGACDILLSPHLPFEDKDRTEFFGSPTKLFEYLASGRAIIASRLGQIGEVIETNKTGILVEPGNEQEFSQAINRLVSDKELRIRLGIEARKSAENNFTWQANVRRALDGI